MGGNWHYFWRGVGSLVNLWPARVDRLARARARLTRPTYAPPAPIVNGGPGAGGENLGLAGVLAWIEFLSRHPELARDEDLAAIRAGLDHFARMPVISRGPGPAAVDVAGDRYRVRQRLVARGRERLATLIATPSVAHVG